ncbi:MAG: PDZ domain-containing protein [Woeseiaceae bacterium]
MKPAVFMPFDLSRETHTTLLWVFEGVTSYYDDLGLVRSGLIDTDSYLELLGQTITRVIRNGGRRRQSVAESSFDAWTKFYKQDANAANAIVSYYAKGALIALSLDLKLRVETRGSVTLDDVMRAAWARWGETGEGMPEDGFETLCSEVAGVDLGDFFDAAVRGTGELPLEKLLSSHGIGYHLRRSSGARDKGGKPAGDGNLPEAWLGADIADHDGKTTFDVVHNGGPAERAGIAPGDELVALDGLRVDAAGTEARARRYKPGDRSEVSLFRGDELLQRQLEWGEAPQDTCYLGVEDQADEDMEALRTAWLGG